MFHLIITAMRRLYQSKENRSLGSESISIFRTFSSLFLFSRLYVLARSSKQTTPLQCCVSPSFYLNEETQQAHQVPQETTENNIFVSNSASYMCKAAAEPVLTRIGTCLRHLSSTS